MIYMIKNVSKFKKECHRLEYYKKIVFLQLLHGTHATKILCTCLRQITTNMQLHAIIFELHIQHDYTIYMI